jgi:hypothetical protein
MSPTLESSKQISNEAGSLQPFYALPTWGSCSNHTCLPTLFENGVELCLKTIDAKDRPTAALRARPAFMMAEPMAAQTAGPKGRPMAALPENRALMTAAPTAALMAATGERTAERSS